MKAFVSLFLVLSVCACTPEKVDPPAAPDIEPVSSAFASPTGTLTAETAERLARDLSSILDAVELVGDIWSEVDEASKGFEGKMDDQMKDEMTQALLASEGLSVRTYPQVEASATAWVQLTYVCGPRESLANGGIGRIVLNMVGDVGVVQTVVWGRFEGCRLMSGDTPTTITGNVVLLPSSANENEGTILTIGADLTKGDSTQTISLDTRFRDGTIDILRTVGDESFVVLGPDANSPTIGIQDSQGIWSCDFENTECTAPMGSGDVQW